MTKPIDLAEFFPKGRLSGRYKLVARKADGPNGEAGTIARETPWFDNIITDVGLEMIGGTLAPIAAAQVGTGTATPSASDVQLQAFVGGSTTVQASTSSAQTTAPYYGTKTLTYRFIPGVATGNISEVGVGKGPTNSNNLFSRALVLDGGGSPTTITVLADEYLDVAYELRIYPPLTDVTGSFTIDGTSYTITTRAMAVTDPAFWASGIGINPFLLQASPPPAWFSGAAGAITAATPAGTRSNASGPTLLAYSAGSHVRDAQTPSSLSSVFTALSFALWSFYGAYQMDISPAISKANTQILTFVTRIGWARKTI